MMSILISEVLFFIKTNPDVFWGLIAKVLLLIFVAYKLNVKSKIFYISSAFAISVSILSFLNYEISFVGIKNISVLNYSKCDIDFEVSESDKGGEFSNEILVLDGVRGVALTQLRNKKRMETEPVGVMILGGGTIWIRWKCIAENGWENSSDEKFFQKQEEFKEDINDDIYSDRKEYWMFNVSLELPKLDDPLKVLTIFIFDGGKVAAKYTDETLSVQGGDRAPPAAAAALEGWVRNFEVNKF